MFVWWPGLYHHARMAPAPVPCPAAMFSAEALVPNRLARSVNECLPSTGEVWLKKFFVRMSRLWSRAASPSFSVPRCR